MKKIICLLLLILISMDVEAQEKPEELYAQSAILMDADTGRVLFEKDGMSIKAMASTTKIMTCILAVEEAKADDMVTFSKYASSQPKVHLGASEGEAFYMEDLLYSLMLESHNDVAVAIAETVAGSVEAFAREMNIKAKEIGCTDTYFITPNGLDAQDEYGFHSTTAVDLARIMSYCIAESPCKEAFLEITSKASHSFSNLAGTRQYSCSNKNTYLSMNQDAISGKTGYTSQAGYCYVGAVESEGRTFVVSLLGCGWPYNRNYKWQDMNKIIQYAMEEYEIQTIDDDFVLEQVTVLQGITDKLFQDKEIEVNVLSTNESILLGSEEEIEVQVEQVKEAEAPIEKGKQLGNVLYTLNGEQIAEYPIISMENVKRIDFFWIFSKIVELYVI